jgi:hypothetical protein
VTIDVVWIGEWIYLPLVYTTLNSTLHTTDTQTSILSLLQIPLSVSWQRFLPRETLQLPALSPLVTAARAELLSTDN